MIIKKLKLTNFLSFKFAEISEFIDSGIIGIISSDSESSNGVGKSNLLNSILYGITGNLDLSLDRIFHHNTSVSEINLLLYDKETNNSLDISRIRDKNNPLRNNIKIKENNIELSLKSNKDIQTLINTKLKTSYTLFKQFNLSNSFMLLNNNDKIKYIENLYTDVQWDKYYVSCLNKLRDLNYEYSNLEGKISILKNDNLKNIYNNKLKIIETLQKEITEILEIITKLTEQKESLSLDYNEYLKNKESISLLKKEISKTEELLDKSKCPVCYNDINKDVILNIISEKKRLYEELNNKIDLLGDNYNKYIEIENKLNEAEVNKKIKLKELDNFIKENSELKELLNNQANNLNILLEKISKVKIDIEHFNFLKEFVIKDGSLFRITFLEDYLGVITSLVSSFLEQLSFPLKCMFYLNEDKEIEVKFDSPISYYQLSSGQKKIFDICVNLAFYTLYKNINKNIIDVLIFDEFLNFLDTKNEESLLILFDNFCKENNMQIFIAAPRLSTSLNKVSQYIQVYKKDGASYVI